MRVTLIQGGGAGLDQIPAVLEILTAVGVRIEWDEHFAGGAAIDRGGAALSPELLASIRATGLALKTKLLAASTGRSRHAAPNLRYPSRGRTADGPDDIISVR